MADESSNETHLVPPRLDRRALAKMRGKLATSEHRGKKAEILRPAGTKRHIRIWPFVIALAMVLTGMEFTLRAWEEAKPGEAAGRSQALARMEPPPGLSLDEQARFWCYAAYDHPKLKARFKLPKGLYFEQREARRRLEHLLAEDLGNAVRNEIFAYQQAHPDPVIAKTQPKPVTHKK
jgi:hypothetical protein